MVNVLFSRIIAISRKDILFCFLRSVVKDMLACQPFRKLRKASKCLGKVNKTKISSTYRRCGSNSSMEKRYPRRKLSNLVKSSISMYDPSKVIFNRSKYELSDCEKRLLA